jgi:flagellar biosynthetic protein FliQ
MTPEAVLDVLRGGVWVVVQISAPMLVTALVVGLVISLLQALTQVQEATLSFVPKILAVMAALVLSAPFALAVLIRFTEELMARVAGAGLG